MPVKLPVRDELQTPDMVPTTGSPGPSMIDSIPLPLVLLLAAPYLAGRTQEEALALAQRIYRQDRFSATIDVLGEDAESDEQCEQFLDNYKQLVDALSRSQISTGNRAEQITLSFKPSMFSTTAPQAGAGSTPQLDRAFERIKSLADYALSRKVALTLEAEDHRWTDFHLETYLALVNDGYTNLGTVLQSRLFRTRNDIKRFDERMRARLVIGIYNEPAEIAHTDKPTMKQLLVEFAGELAERGTYVELATHDAACVDSFLRQVVLARGLDASRFETQFLLGVPRRKLQATLRSGAYFKELARSCQGQESSRAEQLARSGIIVRLYLPYGEENVAGPYCKRRLKANPNMIGYGIKNLLHIQ